jgi:hypothetical protein
MSQVAAQASLGAQPLLACSVLAWRITVPPDYLPPGGMSTHGPVVPDPWVVVPGVTDGIYDT